MERKQCANDDTVAGDLNKMGWVLLRSRCVELHHETEIKNICGKGKWYAIGDSDDTRMMKYQTSSTIPNSWKTKTLEVMFTSI